jgi:lipopolysaccharide transport system permease protein
MDPALPTGAGWVRAEPPSLARIAAEVAALPALLAAERGLIWAGLARGLRLRFGTTALGWAWPLVRPLLLVAAYAVLFTQVVGARPGSGGATAAYVAVGVLVWASLAEGLVRASTSITAHAGLVRRLAFPVEVLPLEVVLVEGVALLLGAGVFLAVGAALGALDVAGGWPWPGSALFALPLVALVQLVLVFGLALGLSALQVVLRDTQHALGAFLMLAMFATPVFWEPAALPGIAPWLGWIEANPLHHLLGAWRAALCGGPFPWASLGYAWCWALVALIAGHALFRSLRPEFADEV